MIVGFLDKVRCKLFNIAYRCGSLPPATIAEQKLISELRSRISQLPEPKMAGTSEAEKTWVSHRNDLRRQILTDDPRNFLNWEIIRRTMFFEPAVAELKFLQSLPTWSKWQKAIKESSVGNPKPYWAYRSSSGNLIHHAYSLSQLILTTQLNLLDLPMIVEFGGGYGSMCRAVYQLGFKGTYIIFDLPEFSALQEYFLKSVGIAEVANFSNSTAKSVDGVLLLSELDELRRLLSDRPDEYIFIATWSISETSTSFRERVFRTASNPQHYLIAYQEKFGEINNTDYFAKLGASNPDYCWVDYPIKHIPGSRYLIGTRLQ